MAIAPVGHVLDGDLRHLADLAAEVPQHLQVTVLDPAVLRGVGEGKRQHAEIHEILPMNPREPECDDHP